jgi:peptidoglycan/LPS O-acetylase OafA/YrhL
MSQLNKFRELQGLRAIAVLSVIGFHLNPELISKGYLGVDIFFIISGFLITRILLNQQTEITLNRFYLNRVKRIYPALILVITTSSVVGYLLARNIDLELISSPKEAGFKSGRNSFPPNQDK